MKLKSSLNSRSLHLFLGHSNRVHSLPFISSRQILLLFSLNASFSDTVYTLRASYQSSASISHLPHAKYEHIFRLPPSLHLLTLVLHDEQILGHSLELHGVQFSFSSCLLLF